MSNIDPDDEVIRVAQIVGGAIVRGGRRISASVGREMSLSSPRAEKPLPDPTEARRALKRVRAAQDASTNTDQTARRLLGLESMDGPRREGQPFSATAAMRAGYEMRRGQDARTGEPLGDERTLENARAGTIAQRLEGHNLAESGTSRVWRDANERLHAAQKSVRLNDRARSLNTSKVKAPARHKMEMSR